jgi:hypothetical protein
LFFQRGVFSPALRAADADPWLKNIKRDLVFPQRLSVSALKISLFAMESVRVSALSKAARRGIMRIAQVDRVKPNVKG